MFIHSFIHSLYRAELGTTSKRFSGQRFPKLHGCLHSRETPQTRLHGLSRYISMIVTDPYVLREEEWKEFRYVVVALMRLLFVSAPRTRADAVSRDGCCRPPTGVSAEIKPFYTRIR